MSVSLSLCLSLFFSDSMDGAGHSWTRAFHGKSDADWRCPDTRRRSTTGSSILDIGGRASRLLSSSSFFFFLILCDFLFCFGGPPLFLFFSFFICRCRALPAHSLFWALSFDLTQNRSAHFAAPSKTSPQSSCDDGPIQ